jgi:hypothetical protein
MMQKSAILEVRYFYHAKYARAWIVRSVETGDHGPVAELAT